MKFFPDLRLLLAIFCLSSVQAESLPPITILCVGDSTVQTYAESNPLRGWGQMLPAYLQPEARIENAAKSGTSSRSFYEQGFWKSAIALQPDYVLIQFGHNDRAKDERGTNPNDTYRAFLLCYVRETKAAGAKPVLIGPMAPRSFSLKDGVLRSNVKPYVEAMRQVAQSENIPFIDLHTPSFAYYAKLGMEGSRALAPKERDINHFNAMGADLMARLVADGLAAQVADLKPYLLNPEEKQAKEIP